MPRHPTSGYARIAQAEIEEEEESSPPPSHPSYSDTEDASTHPLSTSYAPIHPRSRGDKMHYRNPSSSPGRPGRRRRTNSGVDIKAINLRLERWAEEIKEKFKIRRPRDRTTEDERLEIYSSVFQAPSDIRPATRKSLEDAQAEDAAELMSVQDFEEIVESVRVAIEQGTHPLLISQGSSGSYFARNPAGKVLGVFKPKDEEPYANKNPKWTKWIHRNLFPFAFGRAMLIPNLSYVSEAAAYVLDCQLGTGLVPYTDVVGLSSRSFHYDFWERRKYGRKGRVLPEKLGSFQVFLKGYKGATEFFREHPWPVEGQGSGRAERTAVPSQKRKKKGRWAADCRPGGGAVLGDEDGEESENDGEDGYATREGGNRRQQEFWTETLQQSFREELEKLVVLDYVMRNTDRGTDNWMIRIDTVTQTAHLAMEPPKENDHAGYQSTEPMTTTPGTPATPPSSTVRIGAIDNSLSFPWKHPDAWRSYPFGWLFLPVSLIGRPFSAATRARFLPLLTSREWWSDTHAKLRRVFEVDSGFDEKMWARQWAVVKGQGWNVLECLKEDVSGPLELCRRARVLVWDDVVEVPVARPMVRPSEEMRRATQSGATTRPKMVQEEEEEMDISAALSSDRERGDKQIDLLGLSSPDKDSRQNPFNMSRESSSQDISRSADTPSTPPRNAQPNTTFQTPSRVPGSSARPSHTRSATTQLHSRVEGEVPRAAWQEPSAERRRRFSFSFRRASTDADGEEDEDEGDGDLGFAVVGDGGRGQRRKVIVERIEMVRSKTRL
ncbi:Phosphatidylinositol 4-kinase LSB6 [Elasticomyces elasticus]|uniref:Phosphatidylinositol 4-kinase n=1 Tax=Elasticomyces elasticus TaxID=574655 RepID=A0AAN7W8P6_9PEZI|nr:Phosphatidylinositol 4-kinase LSB6 [Elasticomyces elasticus]